MIVEDGLRFIFVVFLCKSHGRMGEGICSSILNDHTYSEAL